MPTAPPDSSPISGFLARCYALVEDAFSGRAWRLKLLLLAVLLAGAVQVPPYREYAVLNSGKNATYNTLKAQVAQPFAMHNLDSDSHESKMVFRLLVPLLIRGLGLPPLGIFVVQFLLGALMHYVLIGLLDRLTADRVATVLLALGLCCTYFGCAFLLDVYCDFDAFSYAILVFMLWTARPDALAGLMFLGAFNDERTVIAAPIIGLWHLRRALVSPAAQSWAGLAKALLSSRPAGALLLGVVAYAAVRLFLAHHFHLHTFGGLVGLSALRYSALRGLLGVGFLSGLESFWAVLLAALVLLFATRQFRLLAVLGLAGPPIFLGAFLVLDMTRSLAYGMPAVLLCLYLLRPHLAPTALRHFAAAVAAGAVLIPTMYLRGNFNVATSVLNYLTTFTLARI